MSKTGSHRPTNVSKYTCNHPFAVKHIDNFFENLTQLVSQVKPASVLSIGCGEGFDVKNVHERDAGLSYCCGLDLSLEALKIAKGLITTLQFDAVQGDIYHLPFRLDEFDTILCLEVLEHLEYPKKVLRGIADRYNGYCVFSVPNEPLYRLTRLLVFRQNIKQLGDHPDHRNHWSKKRFTHLIGRYFLIDQIKTPFPWTIILCHKKESFERESIVLPQL